MSRASREDEIRIRDILEEWARAVRARNIEGVMANHASDILLFEVPPPVRSPGEAAYRQSWELFFKWADDPVTFDLSELSVTAGDDLAFCHGLIRCRAKDDSGETADLLIRLTGCLRKIGGAWTIVHEHHSEPSG
jgi:ketosteroid isomerase-like protein